MFESQLLLSLFRICHLISECFIVSERQPTMYQCNWYLSHTIFDNTDYVSRRLIVVLFQNLKICDQGSPSRLGQIMLFQATLLGSGMGCYTAWIHGLLQCYIAWIWHGLLATLIMLFQSDDGTARFSGLAKCCLWGWTGVGYKLFQMFKFKDEVEHASGTRHGFMKNTMI